MDIILSRTSWFIAATSDPLLRTPDVLHALERRGGDIDQLVDEALIRGNSRLGQTSSHQMRAATPR